MIYISEEITLEDTNLLPKIGKGSPFSKDEATPTSSSENFIRLISLIYVEKNLFFKKSRMESLFEMKMLANISNTFFYSLYY